ncbi:MAG: toll/interleukin-1 receptor domain-containing protein [Hyphomonadaceae bacterium]
MGPYDVFLSYARADAARAALVRDKLEALGLSVFHDAEGIDGGAEFPVIIDQAVKSAKCVLGLWSRAALERRWVRIEGRIGLDQRKLVAAMLDGTRPEDLPAEFYNVNVERLEDFSGADDHPGWARVVRAIGRRVGRPDLGGAAASAPAAAPRPQKKLPLAPWLIGAGVALIGALLVLTQFNHRPAPGPAAPIETAAAVETAAPAPEVETASLKPAAAPAPDVLDLSGQWIGEYWGPAAARTSFAAVLESHGARFRGRIEENNTFAAGAGPVLTANLAGAAREDGALAFRKTYDGGGGVSHSVDYEGRYDPGSGIIAGVWRVGGNAGQFRMQRR